MVYKKSYTRHSVSDVFCRRPLQLKFHAQKLHWIMQNKELCTLEVVSEKFERISECVHVRNRDLISPFLHDASIKWDSIYSRSLNIFACSHQIKFSGFMMFKLFFCRPLVNFKKDMLFPHIELSQFSLSRLWGSNWIRHLFLKPKFQILKSREKIRAPNNSTLN